MARASTNLIASDLAIHGGPAVIPDGPPAWPPADESVEAALRGACRDGSWGRYTGLHGERLRERLAELYCVSNVLLCSSGTYAVEAALRGLGVGPGDEVILAGYDFPGNFRAVESVGALPVLVDVNPGNWSIDPGGLDEAVSERTRAVIASHLHGGLVPMPQLMAWAGQQRIAVVEDTCQAPGASIARRPAGSFGDVGVLSFGGSKLVTAGRGGAVLSRREDVYQRAKIYGQRGNDAYPLSELQAAVVLPQLDVLPERNAVRTQRVARLLERLAEQATLTPLYNSLDNANPSFYKVAWRYHAPSADGSSREEFAAAVRSEGVALDVGFRGFALRSQRRCRHVGDLEHSRRAATDTLLLHHPVLLADNATIDCVADALLKVITALSRSPSVVRRA